MSEAMQTINRNVRTMAGQAGKYLTFRLAHEEYGVEILKVQEIIGMMPVTSIPRTPEFVRGVINLRGKVIPVVDLRRKFHMDSCEDTERTCIIVVEVCGGRGLVKMGFCVDEVSEVLDISGQDIEEAPDFGVSLDTAYILGVAKAKDGVKILVDIDKVLAAEDIAHIEESV